MNFSGFYIDNKKGMKQAFWLGSQQKSEHKVCEKRRMKYDINKRVRVAI